MWSEYWPLIGHQVKVSMSEIESRKLDPIWDMRLEQVDWSKHSVCTTSLCEGSFKLYSKLGQAKCLQ